MVRRAGPHESVGPCGEGSSRATRMGNPQSGTVLVLRWFFGTNGVAQELGALLVVYQLVQIKWPAASGWLLVMAVSEAA